jgi:hypothetical protein
METRRSEARGWKQPGRGGDKGWRRGDGAGGLAKALGRRNVGPNFQKLATIVSQALDRPDDRLGGERRLALVEVAGAVVEIAIAGQRRSLGALPNRLHDLES